MGSVTVYRFPDWPVTRMLWAPVEAVAAMCEMKYIRSCSALSRRDGRSFGAIFVRVDGFRFDVSRDVGVGGKTCLGFDLNSCNFVFANIPQIDAGFMLRGGVSRLLEALVYVINSASFWHCRHNSKHKSQILPPLRP